MDDAVVVEKGTTSPGRPASRDEVEKLVRLMSVEVLMLKDVDPESIDPTREDFLMDLGANSIDALELIVAVEEKLGVEFTDDQMNAELVRTLNHFVDSVCEKLGIPAPAPAPAVN